MAEKNFFSIVSCWGRSAMSGWSPRTRRPGTIRAVLSILALLAPMLTLLPAADAQGSRPPGAPTEVRAVAGNEQVTLTWTTPSDSGSNAIISYEYTYSQGVAGDKGGTLQAISDWIKIPGSDHATTSYTVLRLTNNREYRFKLRAVSSAGNGTESELTDRVTPSTVKLSTPKAPVDLVAIPGNSEIKLSWAPAAATASQENTQNGFSPILYYQYQLKVGSRAYTPWNVIIDSGPTSGTTISSGEKVYPYTISALRNGTTYQVRVRAVNGRGGGSFATTKAVTVAGKPGSPRAFKVVAGDGQATMSWTPSGDNGSPIIGWDYRYRLTDEGSEYGHWVRVPGSNADTTSYTVIGLDNSKKYIFQLRAVNAITFSIIEKASDKDDNVATSMVVNPGKLPGTPTDLSGVADKNSVTLTWTPPAKNSELDDGGSPILRYEYSQKAGDSEWGEWKIIPTSGTNSASVTTTDEQSYEFSELTAGTGYWFRVRAANATGAGRFAETLKEYYPGQRPAAPTNIELTPSYDVRSGDARITISWVPGSDGGSPITKWQFKKASTISELVSSTTWYDICNTETMPTCPSMTSITVPSSTRDARGMLPNHGTGYIDSEDYYIVVRALNSFYDPTDSMNTGGLPSAIAHTRVEPHVPPAPRSFHKIGYTKEPKSNSDARSHFWIISPDFTNRLPRLMDEFSFRVGDGPWSAWFKIEAAASMEQFNNVCCKIGTTYTIRYRHMNMLGSGPYTELKFVWGAPPLPGAAYLVGATTGTLPTLRVSPGTSQVTLKVNNSSTGGHTSTHENGVYDTTAWEYSYKTSDGDWNEWTLINIGKQFNGGVDFVVDGLENGVGYTFRIRGVNDPDGVNPLYGQILESAMPTVPGVTPPAPSKLSVVGGDRQVTLTWVSGGTGGPPITQWQYCELSSRSCTPTSAWNIVPGSHAGTTTTTVTGLTNGTSYTYRVRAVNAIGGGAPIQGLPVVPGRVPGVVDRVVVESGDGEVSVWVAPPVDTGGVPVTGYEVRKKAAGGVYDAWEPLGTSVSGTSSVRPSAERGSGAVVKNLVNGVGYTFQVRAKNAFGVGPEKESSVVVPVGSPTAGELRAEAGDARVVLSWSAGDAGGSTVTEWQYRQQPGDGGYGPWVAMADSDAETATHTVTGLSNGISYTFQIRALTRNQQVTGDPFESPPVTPATVPPPPVGLTAVRGDESVTLSWAPGVSGQPGQDDYAAPTTGWQYRTRTADDSGEWAGIADSDADTTNHDVTSLTNGVAYTFDIRAVNTMGNGAAASATATPATVPSAPEVTVTAANRMVTLEWTPTGNGGTPITGWQLRQNENEWTDLTTLGLEADATTIPIQNLINGTAYTFGIRAVNAVGAGAATSVTVTPAAVPPAPTVTAQPGDETVTLSWASEGDGGSSITGWQVRTDDGQWVDLTTLDLDVDAFGHEVIGLTNGVGYTFGVRALNAKGNGAAASVQATPAAAPVAPEVTVDVGDGEITLSWASDGDGGSAITGWEYRTRIGVGTYGEWILMGADATGTSLTGLDSGTGVVAYTFQVRAINAVGAGTTTTTESVIPVETSTVEDEYYSEVIDGPNFCTRFSLGGARLFPLDSNDDGVADTCSLPYTRREAIARRNAVVNLANLHGDQYRDLVNAACATLEGDEPCGGEVLSPPGYAPPNDGGPYYSGVVTGPAYCANRSLGGPTTYPLDSDGDGVADTCSLPYSPREAIARQIAGDTLAAMYGRQFKNELAEECRRLAGSDYGDSPTDLVADICGS